MKKFGTLLILLFILALGAFLIAQPGDKISSLTSGQRFQSGQGGGAVTNNQEISSPMTLSIPALGVNASIESVGMDSQGRMDVPKNPADVAWYNLGYKPGDNGSAVIAGHLDTQAGAPAVFWNLMKLNIGDTVKLTGNDGKTLTFKVVDKESYPYTNFPIQQVFNTTDKPRLNLITCQGTYSTAAQSYSQRAVVYTELVE
jgi:LPXTG-site transpeptidase (sortase) family protein